MSASQTHRKDASMPSTQSVAARLPGVAGDRVTWKVRRVARRYHSDLGELRFVSSTRAGRWLWVALGGFWLVFSLLTLFGTGTIGERLDAIAGYFILLGGLMWLLIHEKLLVFERGLVLGSFLLGTRPMAIPFHAIDAATLRTSTGWGQRHGMNQLLRFHNGFAGQHERHHCMWATPALTFLGPDPHLVRGTISDARRARRTTPLHPGESVPNTVWSFGTTTPARTQAATLALIAALRDAGAPGTDHLEARALPPRKLTGTAQDAAYLCIPPQQRALNLPQGPA